MDGKNNYNLDIGKIGLYLSGKLPPYYGKSKKLLFVKELKKINFSGYNNDELEFLQKILKEDQEFFRQIIHDIYVNLINKKIDINILNNF